MKAMDNLPNFKVHAKNTKTGNTAKIDCWGSTEEIARKQIQAAIDRQVLSGNISSDWIIDKISIFIGSHADEMSKINK